MSIIIIIANIVVGIVPYTEHAHAYYDDWCYFNDKEFANHNNNIIECILVRLHAFNQTHHHAYEAVLCK